MLQTGDLISRVMTQSGTIVQGSSNLNFSTQQSSYNYTVLSPTVTDLSDYNDTVQYLVDIIYGLDNGRSNDACATGDHRLDRSAPPTHLNSAADSVSHHECLLCTCGRFKKLLSDGTPFCTVSWAGGKNRCVRLG